MHVKEKIKGVFLSTFQAYQLKTFEFQTGIYIFKVSNSLKKLINIFQT